jgi:LCP family protein required for cell wall assembly
MQRIEFQAAPPPTVQPPTRKGPNPSKRKERRFPIWARVAVSVLLVLVILAGAGLAYYQLNFAGHISNITGQKAAPILKGQDGDASQANTTIGNGLGNQRINILLLGSDNDEKFFAPLAQTDIVITIDPTTNYVGMLSIPRDLWINVPGFGAHKLDEAFAYGWQYVHQAPTAFPNAAGLSIATIEQDFGIPITHYAWVGLDGFIKVIDTAGGVDIDAIHPMTDDTYPNDINTKDPYGYKRLYIAPGPQHMDGLHALEYVRTRHSDLVGDFGRSQRQQQVLSQLKTKLATPGIVSELPELTKDLDGYVKTDMDLPGIINLMGFARNLDPNTIDRLVLSPPYSTAFTAPNGEDAFKPVCSLIQPKIAKMFALGSNAKCDVQASSSAVPLASLSIRSPSPARAFASTATDWSLVNLPEQLRTLSSQLKNGDVFGIRSLLDLLFLIAFGSFDAVKV